MRDGNSTCRSARPPTPVPARHRIMSSPALSAGARTAPALHAQHTRAARAVSETSPQHTRAAERYPKGRGGYPPRPPSPAERRGCRPRRHTALGSAETPSPSAPASAANLRRLPVRCLGRALAHRIVIDDDGHVRQPERARDERCDDGKHGDDNENDLFPVHGLLSPSAYLRGRRTAAVGIYTLNRAGRENQIFMSRLRLPPRFPEKRPCRINGGSLRNSTFIRRFNCFNASFG